MLNIIDNTNLFAIFNQQNFVYIQTKTELDNNNI